MSSDSLVVIAQVFYLHLCLHLRKRETTVPIESPDRTYEQGMQVSLRDKYVLYAIISYSLLLPSHTLAKAPTLAVSLVSAHLECVLKELFLSCCGLVRLTDLSPHALLLLLLLECSGVRTVGSRSL